MQGVPAGGERGKQALESGARPCYNGRMNPYLNPRYTPFSCRGSYFAVSCYSTRPDGLPDVRLRTVSRRADSDVVARLSLLVDGAPADCRLEMEPSELRLVADAGSLRLCFGDAETVLFRAESPRLGVRLDFSSPSGIATYGYDFPFGGRTLRLENCFANRSRLILDVRAGVRSDDQDWTGRGANRSVTDIQAGEGGLSASLRIVPTEWDRVLPDWDFDEAAARQRAAFGAFLKGLPAAPAGLENARELAAYVLWSCCVRAEGCLKGEAMLMSKNWMTNVWSWDHCFNSIALAEAHPDIAWEQFIGIFRHQDATGVIPDSISDGAEVFTFCKPPIHGWALTRMMRRMTLTTEQLRTAYDALSRWTEWWLNYRDRDHNGLCEYDHGNDSGWDNSTAFAFPPPVELPDLQAYLVLQMETLADLAGRLGLAAEAESWTARSRALLGRMCALCFDADGRPLARKAFTGETDSPDSLILYLPVILGKRLPERIRTALVRELSGDRFLTEWGYATESPKSPRYEPNGYWLGPIWAPETLILVDGLRACGEEKLARDVAGRFLRLFAKSGSAENFDALTGEGLCDRAYTWASAVFLTLLTNP